MHIYDSGAYLPRPVRIGPDAPDDDVLTGVDALYGSVGAVHSVVGPAVSIAAIEPSGLRWLRSATVAQPGLITG
jgi:hypothetical protein